MERYITLRDFLKLGLAGTLAASLDLEIFGEGAERQSEEWSREKAIGRLRSIENKSVSFLGNTLPYRLIRTGRKNTGLYSVALGEGECIPTWTTGREVYQNVPLYLEIAERHFYINIKQFRSVEEKRFYELNKLRDEIVRGNKESEQKFLKTARNIARWQAVKEPIEEYLDMPKKLENLAVDLMDIHEKHELPSIAIQQRKCPKELARYVLSSEIFDNIRRTGFNGAYNENYAQQKIAALIHLGAIKGTKINPQNETFSLAIDWIRDAEKTKKDPYHKAGSFVLEQIAEKTGGKSIFEGIVNFLKLDSEKKREIFSNLGVELYGVVF